MEKRYYKPTRKPPIESIMASVNNGEGQPRHTRRLAIACLTEEIKTWRQLSRLTAWELSQFRGIASETVKHARLQLAKRGMAFKGEEVTPL